MAAGDGNYVAIADVTIWPEDMDADGQALVIERAEALIEHECRDYFYAKALDIRVSGNGRMVLDLGLQPTLLTITAITFYDGQGAVDKAVTMSNVVVSDFSISGVPWPTGHKNIQVVGTYGWAAIPAAVKKAAKVLVEYELDPTLYDEVQQGTVREGATSHTRPGRTLTGVLQADQLLWAFRRKRAYGGIV